METNGTTSLVNTANISEGNRVIFSDTLRKYFDYTAIVPISCVGMVGNFLSILVFASIKKKFGYHCIMLFLSVFDFLFCVISAGSVVAKQFKMWTIYYFYVIHISQRFVAMNSYILVAVLSFNRFIHVVWPIKSVTWFKNRGTKTINTALCLIICVTAGFHIPYLFGPDPNEEQTEIIQGSNLESNINWENPVNRMFKIFHGVNTVAGVYTPIVVVFICNVVVIIFLRRRKLQLSSMREGQQQGRESDNDEVTKMLLCMSIVFLVCVTIGSGSLRHHLTRNFDADDIGNIVLEVWEILHLVNHSVNFIIYILWTKTFRKYYRNLICCCQLEPEGGENENTSQMAHNINTNV